MLHGVAWSLQRSQKHSAMGNNFTIWYAELIETNILKTANVLTYKSVDYRDFCLLGNVFLNARTYRYAHLFSQTNWTRLRFRLIRQGLLTHRGRMSICASINEAIIGFDNGLSPIRRHTLWWSSLGFILHTKTEGSDTHNKHGSLGNTVEVT